MKRKVFVLLGVILICTMVGGLAAVQFVQNTANNASQFDKMVKVLDETITDNEEYENILIDYMYLTNGYNLTDENAEYIAGLIADGYNAREVLACAYFWLDTNEDISIIQKMCDVKAESDKYDRISTWVEEIFNYITNDKCGVLSEDDVIAYENDGISHSEIMTANRLCRKGVYTIQQILDRVKNGEKLADIAAEIENAINPSAQNFAEPVSDADEILTYHELGMLGESPAVISEKQAAENKTAEEILEEKSDEVLTKAVASLKEKDLLRRGEKNNEVIDEINQNGVKGRKLDKLLKEYDEIDVLNATEISKQTDMTVEELLEENKNGKTWNELAKKAE